MLDIKDFSFLGSQNSFDFKGFLIKTLSYWRWFVYGLTITLFIAYQVNLRQQKVYSLDTTIAVKEQDNPLFTSNSSLIFNWGGASDQVQNIATTLKSRSHNEIVVERLQFYIDYLEQKDYFVQDVYGSTPFVVNIDKNKNQILKNQINIKFLSPNQYELKINFNDNSVAVTNYSDFNNSVVNVVSGEFVRRYKIGEKVQLPFLNWVLELNNISGKNYVGKEYIVQFNTLDQAVSKYQTVKVNIDEKAGSILKLSLDGSNKARIVAYLNETVTTLIKRQLDNKNLFAENTIKFIDTTLANMEEKLKNSNDDLKKFSKNKNVLDLENGGINFQDQIKEVDIENDIINRKLNYYNTLNGYLKNSNDFSKLPAPSVAGIDDPNILTNVSNLIMLSVRRAEMGYSTKGEKMYSSIDNEIESVKKVLLENIRAAKVSSQFDSNTIKTKLNLLQSKISQFPDDRQEFMKIMRKYDLSNEIYQTYLQKRSEAQIVKAANLSDIQFIDPAKDIGGGLIGPKTSINYVMAIFIGTLIPLALVLLLFFINASIQNPLDISSLTDIPMIGVVGVKTNKTNLSVFEKPKSPLSESFRAIRSSLQFLYKKQQLKGSKTLMLTSSVGGEGKTFCSINIATVFALSGKKTVIVGLDLRKPKIFDDFNLNNEEGVVNYLINQKTLEEITQKTKIPFLDIITSGPIPPNPSELIMSENMKKMIDALNEKYDYIILDTPPVGLVTDAVELSQFADVTLYVMRQNFTKKDMVNLLNNRAKRGELNNVSILLNGYESKAKYGAAYGYGYGDGYGYGNYSNGYHEIDEPKNKFAAFFKRLFSIKKN